MQGRETGERVVEKIIVSDSESSSKFLVREISHIWTEEIFERFLRMTRSWRRGGEGGGSPRIRDQIRRKDPEEGEKSVGQLL